MTLGRKMLFKTAGLILSLVLLTGAAVWGLVGLSQQVDEAVRGLEEESGSLDASLAEYQRLSEIFALGQTATRTIFLLNTRGTQDPETQRQMRLTADQYADYRLRFPRRSTTRPATQPDEDAGRLGGEDVLRALRAAIAQAERPDPAHPGPPDPAPQLAAVNALVSHLAELTVYTSRRIGQIQAESVARRAEVDRLRLQAVDRFRTHILLVAGIAVLTILGAAALTVSQHRGVMRPLRRLRHGVRSIASGHFSRRLDRAGDDEFAALAHDFNQMAEELEALYRDLEEKVAVKSRELVRSERLASVGFLAAGVAHEINNPLSIITGHAELLLRELQRRPSPTPGAGASEGAAKTIQSLRVICDEAFRCKQITQKLLALARGSPGGGKSGGPTEREPVSLATVAQDVAVMVRALTAFQRRRLILRFDNGQKARVLANESEMKQVLLNLTVNALEAVPDDGGEVVIEGVRRGDTVELTVRDNGRGMSPQTLERIFEPFYTEKRGVGPAEGEGGAESGGVEGGGQGTGLGLSIVHAIVESHGGTIRAASEGLGKGSRFVVTLPAVP